MRLAKWIRSLQSGFPLIEKKKEEAKILARKGAQMPLIGSDLFWSIGNNTCKIEFLKEKLMELITPEGSFETSTMVYPKSIWKTVVTNYNCRLRNSRMGMISGCISRPPPPV